MKKVLPIFATAALPVMAAPLLAEEAQSNFNGLYVGVLASHTTMHSDYTLQPKWYAYKMGVKETMHTAEDWQGGIALGYNWDIGQPQGWVIGIEADYFASGLGVDTLRDNSPHVLDLGGDVVSVAHQVTVRGRVGYDFNGLMPYVAAGLSCADITVWSGHMPYELIDESGFACGGTAAAGAEYAVGNGWAVRGEYRVTDFGNVKTEQGIIGITYQF